VRAARAIIRRRETFLRDIPRSPAIPTRVVAVAEHRDTSGAAQLGRPRFEIGASTEITVSSNEIPATLIASHGRNDHDE
jgi:hypothetical protein